MKMGSFGRRRPRLHRRRDDAAGWSGAARRGNGTVREIERWRRIFRPEPDAPFLHVLGGERRFLILKCRSEPNGGENWHAVAVGVCGRGCPPGPDGCLVAPDVL